MATATAKKATDPQALELPPLETRDVLMNIVGDSELITHAWSEKAKREMLDKQMGKARSRKEPKNPQSEYESAFYRTPDGNPAMRTIAFKAAAVNAATQVQGLTKVFLRGAFHVLGELVEIQGLPYMREDMVRIAMGTADIRFRPGFPEWSVQLPVRFNSRSITLEQLLHLFNTAGFSTGVCEWRPEKNGSYDMFHVDDIQDLGLPSGNRIRDFIVAPVTPNGSGGILVGSK